MNLFLCTSAFQLVLTDKIIKDNQLLDVKILYLKEKESSRDSYLVDNFTQQGCQIVCIKTRRQFTQFYLKHLLNEYSSIFIASLYQLEFWLICSTFKYKHLCSFDDGINNYYTQSPIYKNVDLSWSERTFLNLFGSKIFSLDDIKSKINLHIALTQAPNVIDCIDRFSFPIYRDSYQDGIINIFLCPDFIGCFVNSAKEREQFLHLVSPNDMLLPHPKDNQTVLKYPDEKVPSAEYFINDLLDKNHKINLYSYANNTQLYFFNCNAVNQIVITSSNIKPPLRAINNHYLSLFKTSHQIYITDIEALYKSTFLAAPK